MSLFENSSLPGLLLEPARQGVLQEGPTRTAPTRRGHAKRLCLSFGLATPMLHGQTLFPTLSHSHSQALPSPTFCRPSMIPFASCCSPHEWVDGQQQQQQKQRGHLTPHRQGGDSSHTASAVSLTGSHTGGDDDQVSRRQQLRSTQPAITVVATTAATTS